VRPKNFARNGWPIAGHLIGQFPHEKIAGDKVTLYVHPDSHVPMRSLKEKGRSAIGFWRSTLLTANVRSAAFSKNC
jgi:hypothetical protein